MDPDPEAEETEIGTEILNAGIPSDANIEEGDDSTEEKADVELEASEATGVRITPQNISHESLTLSTAHIIAMKMIMTMLRGIAIMKELRMTQRPQIAMKQTPKQRSTLLQRWPNISSQR